MFHGNTYAFVTKVSIIKEDFDDNIYKLLGVIIIIFDW